MHPKRFISALTRLSRPLLAIMLVCSVLLTAPLPPAKAAKKPVKETGQHLVGCNRVVKASPGDTIQKIAKKTHLDWRELARQNNLDPHYPLEAGTQVCLYNLGRRLAGQNATTAVSTIASTTTLTVTTSSFLNTATFKVKTRVRGGELPPHTFQVLGTLHVPSRSAQTTVYPIPVRMGDTAAFDLCLKNQETDELFCQPITMR